MAIIHFSCSQFRIANVRFALDFFFEIAHFSFTCHFELARDPTFAYEVHCIYIYRYGVVCFILI